MTTGCPAVTGEPTAVGRERGGERRYRAEPAWPLYAISWRPTEKARQAARGVLIASAVAGGMRLAVIGKGSSQGRDRTAARRRIEPAPADSGDQRGRLTPAPDRESEKTGDTSA